MSSVYPRTSSASPYKREGRGRNWEPGQCIATDTKIAFKEQSRPTISTYEEEYSQRIEANEKIKLCIQTHSFEIIFL